MKRTLVAIADAPAAEEAEIGGDRSLSEAISIEKEKLGIDRRREERKEKKPLEEIGDRLEIRERSRVFLSSKVFNSLSLNLNRPF